MTLGTGLRHGTNCHVVSRAGTFCPISPVAVKHQRSRRNRRTQACWSAIGERFPAAISQLKIWDYQLIRAGQTKLPGVAQYDLTSVQIGFPDEFEMPREIARIISGFTVC